MILNEWTWRSETPSSSSKNGLDLERLGAEKVACMGRLDESGKSFHLGIHLWTTACNKLIP